jgi:hypothetical protein
MMTGDKNLQAQTAGNNKVEDAQRITIEGAKKSVKVYIYSARTSKTGPIIFGNTQYVGQKDESKKGQNRHGQKQTMVFNRA